MKFYEKREREERKTVRFSITADPCLYRIFEIRVRVTSSGRISLIARQENIRARRTPGRESYLILHKIQGAMIALTFSYTASRFHCVCNGNNPELRSMRVIEFRIRRTPRQRQGRMRIGSYVSQWDTPRDERNISRKNKKKKSREEENGGENLPARDLRDRISETRRENIWLIHVRFLRSFIATTYRFYIYVYIYI